MDLASVQNELARHTDIQLLAGWTNDDFLKLLEMYHNKCTLQTVAVHFGRTKGQISGILHRARSKGIAQKVHERKIYITRPAKDVGQKADPATINELKLAQRLVRHRVKRRRVRLRLIEDHNQVTFAELESHHCRWPLGDPRRPDFRFCGCHRVEGKPYCQAHVVKAGRIYESTYQEPRRSIRPFYRP